MCAVENPDGSVAMFVFSTALGGRRGAGVLARQMFKDKVLPQETQERFLFFLSSTWHTWDKRRWYWGGNRPSPPRRVPGGTSPPGYMISLSSVCVSEDQ